MNYFTVWVVLRAVISFALAVKACQVLGSNHRRGPGPTFPSGITQQFCERVADMKGCSDATRLRRDRC